MVSEVWNPPLSGRERSVRSTMNTTGVTTATTRGAKTSLTLPVISLDFSNLSTRVRVRPPIEEEATRITPRMTIGIRSMPALCESQVDTGRAECER